MATATGASSVLRTTRVPNGGSIAAILAAAIGLLALGITAFASELNPTFNTWLLNSVGKLWIPNAQGIGPYSGKETFMLVGWLVSWVALHFALRRRDVNVRLWLGVALVLVLAAGILIWPPVWHLFVD